MDSDAFLTQIESKLRCPFTSIDFAKTVTSSSNESNEYLLSVLSVLPRAEKVTQLRMLIGLLGLEPSKLLDDEIQHVLTITQNGQLYEEWVRVISGVVEDILFRNDADPIDKREASRLVDKTSSEILYRLKELEKGTTSTGEETGLLSAQSDSNPLFVPYIYNLLSPSLVKAIIPDSKAHAHFSINTDSEILHADMNMEIEKTKEEQDHHVAISTYSKSNMPPTPSVGKETAVSVQLLKNSDQKLVSTGVKSSSMFMPSKPHSGVGRGAVGTRTVLKPQLHQRKAGAAQALLSKGRRARIIQSAPISGHSVTAAVPTMGPRQIGGRTAVTMASTSRGALKSKMKMIDVAEVQGLETKKQQEVGNTTAQQKALLTHNVSGRKRPHEELGTALKGRKNENSKSAAPPKKSSFENEHKSMVKTISNVSPTETGNAGELASAALLAYQSRTASMQPIEQSPSELNDDSSLNITKQQDWRELLQLRSNRLTEDDRQRIQQFFVDRYNPTPGQRQYKMKLHEERINDALTGKAMKETYYLELDYETYTSTQTKKIKRYDDH